MNNRLANTLLLARLPLGMSLLGHGIVRLPKLGTFAQGMTKGFADTWLPETLVRGFGYALPIVELLLGAIILLGIGMRLATMAGVLLMCVLIFGSSLIENWSAVATQMFYGLYFALLYYYAEDSRSLLSLFASPKRE